MSKADDHIEAFGQPGGGWFAVQLGNGATVLCRLAGRLQGHSGKVRIKVMIFDRVRVLITLYRLDRGIITYRRLN